MTDKKNEKIVNLQEEFNKIQEENKDLDVNMYLAKMDDLPELGEIQIYNYDSDLDKAKVVADNLLGNLVDLYLGDAPKIKEHPYIINKLEEDAKIYAKTIFLTEMTTKTFIGQLRQVDNGDNNPRMYEVMNQTMGEYRDNIKFAQSQRTELEKFWKEMRKDMGLNEMQDKAPSVELNEEGEAKDENMVVGARQMNDLISAWRNKKD